MEQSRCISFHSSCSPAVYPKDSIVKQRKQRNIRNDNVVSEILGHLSRTTSAASSLIYDMSFFTI